MKNIKTIQSSIAWSSIACQNIPVHVIACYIANGTGKEPQMQVERLRHVLNLILNRLPKSRVIVAGDFNGMVPQANQICLQKGLKSLIIDTPTHRQGGMLD